MYEHNIYACAGEEGELLKEIYFVFCELCCVCVCVCVCESLSARKIIEIFLVYYVFMYVRRQNVKCAKAMAMMAP